MGSIELHKKMEVLNDNFSNEGASSKLMTNYQKLTNHATKLMGNKYTSPGLAQSLSIAADEPVLLAKPSFLSLASRHNLLVAL